VGVHSGGSLVKVEVSVDGGATWNLAQLSDPPINWAYAWKPTSLGPATLKSRAFDDKGNVQDPPTAITVTVDNMDRTPPKVTSFFPRSRATEVNANSNVTVTFDEAMDAATVNGSTIELRDLASSLVQSTVTYDADSFTATLDPTAPLSAGATYTARVKGQNADQSVKDVAGNRLIVDVIWTFTIAVPPQVVSTTPTDDAHDVPAGAAPRATFSKRISLSSLTSSTVLLHDSEGNSVPVNISSSFGNSPTTVAIVPQRLLQPLQTYTVTLKGDPEEPHISDLSGTPLPSNKTWSFKIAAAAPPMTIFAPDDTPENPVFNDPNNVEVGLKFRSDTDGIITGVRFYKGDPTNGGEHVGNLWAGDGTLLGSVTFTDETESGWQQALFQAPIPIMANTTYVVSYIAPHGNYAATIGQFASDGAHNPPLHALQNGVEGGNGVFRYNPNGEVPTDSSNSTNYWVDVVFSDQPLAPPQVLSTMPAPGSSVFSFFPEIVPFSITFSEPIDLTSVNESTVALIDTEGNPVPFAISFGADNFRVTLTPLQELFPQTVYTVILKGGDDSPHITDATGTPLAADYTWSITTE